jgi:hypothetical protein
MQEKSFKAATIVIPDATNRRFWRRGLISGRRRLGQPASSTFTTITTWNRT